MRRALAILFALAPAVTAGCRPAAPAGATPAAAVQPRFVDVTAEAGIRFTHFTGAEGRYYVPESVGPGGAFVDYNQDGWLDLYLVNSSNWPDRPAAGKTGALYRNLKDGTFRDVTREAGLAQPLYGQGCTVGDFDGDGWEDLLVTCVGQNRLYRNRGDGTFRDVTKGSGLDDCPKWAWHTSAAWVDYDRDGRLDLFICRYVKWTPVTHIPLRTTLGNLTYAGPQRYPGDASVLYRNLGSGKFENVTVKTGIASGQGKGLGVVPVDENEDGWVDLFVTNDMAPNYLWRNQGGKRFIEAGQEAGIAVGDTGIARAGMGADISDTRSDGGLALAIGNFTDQGLALFDRSGPLYTDQASRTGLVPASNMMLTFGLLFTDADRDGSEDLFVYNGHVDPYAEDADGRPIFKQPPALFRGTRGTFTNISAAAGDPFTAPQVGRGCARGDWNNDGRPDLLLCENGGPTRLLRNDTPDQHHWLGVEVRGAPGNPRGYGAEVRVSTGSTVQRRWVRSGSSYLSHSDPRALFGLGSAAVIDYVEVRWPGGKTTRVNRPPLDRYLTLDEAT